MPTSTQQEQPEAAPLILELLEQSPASEGTALMLPVAAGRCLAPLSLLSLPRAQPQEWLQEGGVQWHLCKSSAALGCSVPAQAGEVCAAWVVPFV